MRASIFAGSLLAASALVAPALAAGASTASGAGPVVGGYVLEKTVPLGAPDRWDYVVFDREGDRVYLAHGDRLTVVDPETGRVAGEVTGIPGGTHGVAISHRSGRGYTDDGKGQVVGFDLRSLQVTSRADVAEDADAMALDPVTGQVFVMHGDPKKVSVVAPASGKVVKVIDAGEKLEYAAADGMGSIFIAGTEKRDVLKLDTRRGEIVARWPVPDCPSPHGLAVDGAGHRVFVGCVNATMMVVDTRDGHVVAKLPIGRGNDAVAFDNRRKRVFATGGVDGTASIYQQAGPNDYTLLETLPTAITGRTLDVDPKTGRLFVAAVEVDPPATPGGAPRRKAGTLRLLVYRPAS
ncbi:MAG TPA: hypothetical protein VG248_10915 [Caulobacteraceae bacterium]|jgi:DNA-binding beta-propeller fold protein YncE|nr:hypothetical protein [Caulobacteraceae bacterium]